MQYKVIFKGYLILVFMISGCSKNINSEQEYLQYISNPKHNLTKTRYINGFRLSVKYMPPEILAYNELQNKVYIKSFQDSIIGIYENSRTFILTIAPDDRKNESNDIMFYNVMNTLDFKERVQTMNFNINEYISLNTEKNTFYPALHLFENTYGLSKHRNLNVVFSRDIFVNKILRRRTNYILPEY